MKKQYKKDFNIINIRDFIDRTSVFEIEYDLRKLKLEQFYHKELIEIKVENISDILKIKNPYLCFYLLLNCPNDSLDFNEKDVMGIYKILSKIRFILDNKELSTKFIDIFLRKVNGISIYGSIKILSALNLSQMNIEQIRKIFGYNVIYKTYKEIIEDIYLKEHTIDELGLVMKLLDNEKLSFSRSLDTFIRLNEYISNEIIDKNLTSCCTVLIAIIKYSPNMIIDKKDFLNSMLAYLINILFERSNFTFYDQHDTDILLSTIKILCEVESVKLTSYDFKTGLIRRCLFSLNLFMKSNSSIYEEVMSFIAILRSFGIFLNLSYSTKSSENKKSNRFKIVVLDKKNEKNFSDTEKIDFEPSGFLKKISDLITPNFINDLEKYKLPNNLCLGYKDDELAKIRFISAKFYVLNNISMFIDTSINRVHFYNDVYSQTKPKAIFDNVSNLKAQISWSDLIILATHSKSKFDFIPILLDPFYTQNLEHLSYIFLFVFSLKDDYDSILYLTKSLADLDSFIDVEKYWEILVYIYIHYLDVNDERIRKTRLYIIKKCVKHNEALENILKVLIRDCRKDRILINSNLCPLLFFIIFNLKKIDSELFLDCYKYIETSSNNDYKALKKSDNRIKDRIDDKLEAMCIHEKIYIKFRTQDYKEDDSLYRKLTRSTVNVSLLIQLMSVYKPKVEEIVNMFSFDSYNHIVAAFTYVKIGKLIEDPLILSIFGFVLDCAARQQKVIKRIFHNYKKSNHYKSFRLLKKLAKMSHQP